MRAAAMGLRRLVLAGALLTQLRQVPADAARAMHTRTCQPKSGNALGVRGCSADAAEGQEWVLPTGTAANVTAAAGAGASTATVAGPIHLKVTYVEGLCMDAGKGTLMSEVEAVACDPARTASQTFELKSAGTPGTVRTWVGMGDGGEGGSRTTRTGLLVIRLCCECAPDECAPDFSSSELHPHLKCFRRIARVRSTPTNCEHAACWYQRRCISYTVHRACASTRGRTRARKPPRTGKSSLCPKDASWY